MYSAFVIVFVLGGPCWSLPCPAQTGVAADRRRVRRGRGLAVLSGICGRGVGRRRDSAGEQGVTGPGADLLRIRLESVNPRRS